MLFFIRKLMENPAAPEKLKMCFHPFPIRPFRQGLRLGICNFLNYIPFIKMLPKRIRKLSSSEVRTFIKH